MSKATLTLENPIFNDEDEARKFLEKTRWPDGPICPHCGVLDEATALHGKTHRKGLYQCKACHKQFSVTVGTIFERSKVPLHKWLLATHLMTSSKKGYSAHQLHRNLGVTYKTSWFMAHRIREAMREPNRNDKMGGGGSGPIEADETFLGPNKKTKDRLSVLTLVERNGAARSFHVADVKARTLKPVLKKHLHKDTTLYTDGALMYRHAGFKNHEWVDHSIGEYVRGGVHTNSVEGFFGIMKRGLKGIYQHVSEKHLKRYLAEYDFRYTYRSATGYEDLERTRMAIRGIQGKRLTYLPIVSG